MGVTSVESRYVTIVETDTPRRRQFWADGRLIGVSECIRPEPVFVPSEIKNKKQKAVYKVGDRVVVEKTRSAYLTIGKTYAIEECHQGRNKQYLKIENDKHSLSEITGEKVRPATEGELEI